ncbi:MAG: hypothetical protein ACKOXK_03045 [Chakrabartia sp.]
MDFQIELRGADYWAQAAGGAAFFVGRRVRFGGRTGLMNDRTGPAYVARHYLPDIGIWASALAPTIACEGGRFCALNSYDRARFSFGIGQFAAHVPEGDFVGLMRRLLILPEAAAYLPDLCLAAGRICRAGPDAPEPLESGQSSARLALWCNPHRAQIDGQEAQLAARLIHWTAHHRSARLVQLAQMIASFRAGLGRACRHLEVSRLAAPNAVVIADVLHHGRGGARPWARLAAALDQPEALAALLDIGARRWPARIAALRAALQTLPELAAYHWDRTLGDFGQ